MRIVSGRLGPLGPTELDIRPLTVLIGRQGTGKSLVAQMLYFFRGLPDLVRLDAASERPDEAGGPGQAVRRIINGMRSSRRSFARLTIPNVALRWSGTLTIGAITSAHDVGLNADRKSLSVKPLRSLAAFVRAVSSARDTPLTAVFVPTERLLYAMALGPTSLKVISAPVTLQTFTQVMEQAGRIQSDWPGGIPDTPQGRWIRKRMARVLGGEGERRKEAWRWSFEAGGSRHSIDFDMASSGQRANWPLSIIPQVLFSLRKRGELAEDFTLYVEEPEIHLHPDAERAVVEVLAYLVNNGMRVVVTTHSLTVLYAINNLLMASTLGPGELTSEIRPQIRLLPEDVAAYHLQQDGTVESLLSNEGTISEAALGSVADALSMQMNRILAKKGPPK